MALRVNFVRQCDRRQLPQTCPSEVAASELAIAHVFHSCGRRWHCWNAIFQLGFSSNVTRRGTEAAGPLHDTTALLRSLKQTLHPTRLRGPPPGIAMTLPPLALPLVLRKLGELHHLAQNHSNTHDNHVQSFSGANGSSRGGRELLQAQL